VAGCWWLTPIILATQEAEFRRIEVHSQPRQIVLEKPFTKLGLGGVAQGESPEFKPQYWGGKEKFNCISP
jgi:hypothetical protein